MNHHCQTKNKTKECENNTTDFETKNNPFRTNTETKTAFSSFKTGLETKTMVPGPALWSLDQHHGLKTQVHHLETKTVVSRPRLWSQDHIPGS